MIKLIKFSAIFFILVFLISNTNALATPSISIKKEFKIGDVIEFNYTINSSMDQEIEYLVGVDCPEIPQAPLISTSKNIKENESFTGTYAGLAIDNLITSQRCFAYLSILEPYKDSVSKE